MSNFFRANRFPTRPQVSQRLHLNATYHGANALPCNPRSPVTSYGASQISFAPALSSRAHRCARSCFPMCCRNCWQTGWLIFVKCTGVCMCLAARLPTLALTPTRVQTTTGRLQIAQRIQLASWFHYRHDCRAHWFIARANRSVASTKSSPLYRAVDQKSDQPRCTRSCSRMRWLLAPVR